MSADSMIKQMMSDERQFDNAARFQRAVRLQGAGLFGSQTAWLHDQEPRTRAGGPAVSGSRISVALAVALAQIAVNHRPRQTPPIIL
jgi:hypothetical protein|eukprot:COSAG02_NODE_50_length_44860_cov_203.992739_38_plen_87_part_00